MMDLEQIRKIPVGIRQEIRNNLLSQQFSNKYCQKCKLFNDKIHPYIEGRGDRSSKLLLIGEAPGKTEDIEGQVFIGRSGQILQNILDRNNISCYISNAVLCRPTKDGKNKTPTPTEIKCCTPFTIKLIQEMQPGAIITLGRIPMKQLLPINLTMKVARGKQFYHPELKTTIIPTYHPAYLARANDLLLYQQFERDLILANRIAYLPPKRFPITTPKSLTNPHEIEDYLRYLLTVDAVAIDLETEGLNPRQDPITDISFCAKIGEGVHISWDNMEPHFELLAEVLTSPTVMKFGHNFKFDMQFLRAVGFKIVNYNFDTMLGEHTYTMSLEGNEVAGLYKLETLVWQYSDLGGYEQLLGKGGIVSAQVRRKTKKEKIEQEKKKKTEVTISIDDDIAVHVNNNEEENEEDFEEKDSIELYDEELDIYAGHIENTRKKIALERGFDLEHATEYYSALDADSTFRIYTKQKIIIERDYKELFYEIIIPLSYALMVMEENGLKLDVEYMNKIYNENLEYMNAAKEKLFKAVGKSFDIQSNPQLKDVVFNILKVKKNEEFKTPKGGYSLDVNAMNYYATKEPVLENILEYRKYQKQSSTYITGFKKFLEPETDRVHSTYSQNTTATGRLSNWNPAVHTVPRDNRIRNMVIPSDGNKLIIADLSQIELRILAMLSGDPDMIDAFESGMDFHSATACRMFKIPFEKFDKENPNHDNYRTCSKQINFGIIYGRGPGALAAQLDISFKEAAEFMETFYITYPQVRVWMYRMQAFAKQCGYVETLYGRRRYLPNLFSSDSGLRSKAERQVVNTIVQSSAGDINNIAITRIQKYLDEHEEYKSLIVADVHDSIISDSPVSENEHMSQVMIDYMTKNIPKITIPLKVDVQILDKWTK